MTDILTDPELLAALKEAAGRAMSPKEVRAQRISFVMGAVSEGSNVSRAEVENIIDRQEGRAA